VTRATFPCDHRSSAGETARPNPVTPPRDFKAYLLSIPSLEDVDLTRDKTPGPDIDL
jgi:hypothetical protein